MTQYEKLTIAARYYLHGKGFMHALDAMQLGREVHNGTRKDGVTPEFMHQIQILHWARTLESSLLYPEWTYIAILLHDAPEDKIEQVSHELVARRYPEEAAKAIFRLDKTGKSEEFYFSQIAQHPIASIAKLGDRIHNMSTMTGVFSREKQLKYMVEVEKYFMPMIKTARRLFPFQEAAYENAKHVLNIQLDLLDVINGNSDEK